ncbi:MAG: hypothetical protein U9N47_11635 [Thermodesulfobacteriota bacterium]|nr:hypothetical protein [Thermodesulfobacteriota bacterium]
MKNLKVLWWSVILVVMLTMTVPVFAGEGDVILNPGKLVGSVSVTGYQITQITVRALDTDKVYSATVTANVPAGANSIDYLLVVEGDRDYYVVAEATVVAEDYTKTVLPLAGPVNIPIYENPEDEVTLDMSMEPAIISGTISTSADTNSTIENYSARAYIWIPELNINFHNYTSAYSLSEPGIPGRDYTLLVAPWLNYNWSITTGIDGINYSSNSEAVTAPAAGATLDKDFTVDVTAATVSGTAILQGMDVYNANIYGYAYDSSSRSNNTNIDDINTGAYTLDVDAGTWYLSPRFNYYLPGDLNDLTGYLNASYTTVPDITNGENRTGVDFIINPGFIPGTLNLWGANVNYSSAQVRAYEYPGGAQSHSQVDPETGQFMYVCSPGDWMYDYYQYMYFDYPEDSDTSLRSSVYQYHYSNENLQTVTAGETVPDVNLTYGTITVRRYFYVAGEGMLSQPYIIATRSQSPSSRASGYGSNSPTTEGQAIVTLLLPGEYSLEAFANVNGSQTEFGTIVITVEEGDVVVIGGTGRPTIKVTNPTDQEIICGNKVTVEGTVTDDVGVASITINDVDVAFVSTGNPNDSNEVEFSYELSLPVIGDNPITIIVTDLDETEPVILSMTVIREEGGSEIVECAVDIKPGSCPNPLNVNSKGLLPVAILGTDNLDVTTIDLNTIRLMGVAPVRSDYEDVGTPFYPLIGKEDKLDCHEEDGDGIGDLSLKFDRQEIVQAIEQSSQDEVVDGKVLTLSLTGNLLEDFGGNEINGEDVIIIIRQIER